MPKRTAGPTGQPRGGNVSVGRRHDAQPDREPDRAAPDGALGCWVPWLTLLAAKADECGLYVALTTEASRAHYPQRRLTTVPRCLWGSHVTAQRGSLGFVVTIGIPGRLTACNVARLRRAVLVRS